MAHSPRVLGLRTGQLRVAACLYLCNFPQTAECRVRLVARSGLRSLWDRGAGGGGMLATAWLAARSLSGPAHHPALSDYLRMRVRVALSADSPPMAVLRDLPRS